jgi:hypothetical protein
MNRNSIFIETALLRSKGGGKGGMPPTRSVIFSLNGADIRAGTE